jgi:hypothetical protein
MQEAMPEFEVVVEVDCAGERDGEVDESVGYEDWDVDGVDR